MGAVAARLLATLGADSAADLLGRVIGGEAVVTIALHDIAAQPLQWIAQTSVAGNGDHAPIRFATGVIGNDAPLVVSPNHRVLLGGAQVELLFGTNEVLVPAKALVNGHSITRDRCAEVSYWHLMFDRHELVRSNGAWSESYFAFAASRTPEARAMADELAALFPRLIRPAPSGELIRPAVTVHEGRLLAAVAV